MKKHLKFLFAVFAIFLLMSPIAQTALAGEPPNLGEIRMTAANYAPRGWAFCEGQLMPKSQFPQLATLLGKRFGGDDKITFGLPDLREAANKIRPAGAYGFLNYIICIYGYEPLSKDTYVPQSGNSQPYMAEMTLFSGDFAPRGWAFCEGQTLMITHYTALFSLIGNVYGGDGKTSFNLPDMRDAEKNLGGARYIISLHGGFPQRN